jgi:hypothetical protein
VTSWSLTFAHCCARCRATALCLYTHTHAGKTYITESTTAAIGRGYSAVYYYNKNATLAAAHPADRYRLATSVLRQSNGSLTVDVPLSSVQWLEQLRTDGQWLQNSHYAVTSEQHIAGKRFIVSAQCQTKNTIINSDGSNDQLVEFDGTPTSDCWAYLVTVSASASAVRVHCWQRCGLLAVRGASLSAAAQHAVAVVTRNVASGMKHCVQCHACIVQLLSLL